MLFFDDDYKTKQLPERASEGGEVINIYVIVKLTFLCMLESWWILLLFIYVKNTFCILVVAYYKSCIYINIIAKIFFVLCKY